MFRRLKRPLVHLLVAAQLLLSAPMVNAFETLNDGGAMPCAESMDDAQDHDCPCCPEGVQSMAGCLAACVAGAAMTSNVMTVAAPAANVETRGVAVVRIACLADPPLKPPPIC